MVNLFIKDNSKMDTFKVGVLLNNIPVNLDKECMMDMESINNILTKKTILLHFIMKDISLMDYIMEWVS
jgi:predicted lactoylglutathione lyase